MQVCEEGSASVTIPTRTHMSQEIPTVDVLIVGAGCAGLFLLDSLVRKGISALLIESKAFGLGQTTSSQGILHAGVKYSLGGLAGDDATEAAAAASLWSKMLSGDATDLRAVRKLADRCYLWRTAGLAGAAGMLGAKVALRTRPEPVTKDARPLWLKDVGGEVLTLAETVIDPRSLLSVLAQRHVGRIALGNVRSIVEENRLQRVDIESTRPAIIRARQIFLTAGAGNEALSKLAGNACEMQRRPLRQAMIRGPLEMVFGHCIDGAKTRVTITSDRISKDEVVWHIGGQVAEDGPRMTLENFRAHAIAELRSAIPKIDLQGCSFESYDVDRAEPRTADGRRPPRAFARTTGSVTTVWPIKLVLAPVIAAEITASTAASDYPSAHWPSDMPAPEFAQRPWEVATLSWNPIP